jgi:Domain of unknown function (DUF4105)
MASFFIKKGGRNASFFIVAIFFSYISAAQSSIRANIDESKLSELGSSSTWLALLHSSDNKPFITDPDFLLTKIDFSPRLELLATLDYLYSGQIDAVCRFPARYYWLKNELNLPNLDLSKCYDLIEFEKKAPADSISLIFASENITQASSMMGHVLIKISGINDKGVKASHAISFYTNIEGFNLPKIIYQNIFSGKKGYFSLSPYHEKLSRYGNQENRNIWEYELDIDNFRKKLMQYHIYEIKQTRLVYYFHKYNCATMTQFILAVAGKGNLNSEYFGTSPSDAIKQAEKNNLFYSVKLIAAKKWKLRMLRESMQKSTIAALKKSIQNGSANDLNDISGNKEKFLAYEALETYARLQLEKRNDPESQRLLHDTVLERNKIEEFNIDLGTYKTPTKTPPDSQISVGAFKVLNDESIFINILPTSHKLEDDNAQYFGETSLALGELSFSKSGETDSLQLESITVYGIKSLIPHDELTGGLSGSFELGARQQYNSEFRQSTKSYINGAIGKTYSLGRDISIYGLFGGGMGITRHDFFGELSPEMGIIIKEVFNMKTMVSYQHALTDSRIFPDSKITTITQSIYLSSSWGLFGSFEKIAIGKESEKKYSLWLKHYF